MKGGKDQEKMRGKEAVVVGMSGGSDSSAAACLLREEGYRVIGVTLRLFGAEKKGRSPEEAAAGAARELGVRHLVVDLRKGFRRQVVLPFIDAYCRGRTPNPCVVCNALCKLPALLDVADELGAEYVATGHYAMVGGEGGCRFILRGRDRSKDQSYVLWRLTGDVLSRLRLPVGGHLKEEVRRLALQLGSNARPLPESRDICFLFGGDYRELISRERPEVMRPGPVVDAGGRMLGMHRGIAAYTVGQRRGLSIASPRPLYVIAIEPERNLVVVGGREEAVTRRISAVGAHWLEGGPPSRRFYAQVKVRYQMEPVPAEVAVESGDSFLVELEEPVPAAAPGQSVVVYEGEVLLGGGIIERGWP